MNLGRIARKRPALAAFLVVIFGPLGVFYLGWQPACAYLLVYVAFSLLMYALGFGSVLGNPEGHLMVSGFLAYKAHAFVKGVQQGTFSRHSLDEVGGPLRCWILISTDAMVGMSMGLAAAVGLIASYSLMFVRGQAGRGIALLLVGTPVMIAVAGFVFGFLALGIDAVALGTWKRGSSVRHAAAPR